MTEEGREIPEAVTRQFDNLMSYYVANAETLKIEHQRATALQSARERYKAAHPEQPKDIVVNFFPIQSPQGGRPATVDSTR